MASPLAADVLAAALEVVTYILQHSPAAAAEAVSSAARFVQLLKSSSKSNSSGSSQTISDNVQASHCLSPGSYTYVRGLAANALAHMAGHNPAFKTAVAAADAIPELVACLEPTDDEELQVQAAAALACIYGDHPVNASAAAAAGGIAALVACLRASRSDRLVTLMTGALERVLHDEANCRGAITAGAIPQLLNRSMQHSDEAVRAWAVDVLAVMASYGGECRDAVVAAGAIPRLVRCLSVSSSEHMLLSAAWNLSKLSIDSVLAQLVVAAGALPAVVQLLSANCSPGVEAELLQLLGTLQQPASSAGPL
jgi:vacuolar protein 8